MLHAWVRRGEGRCGAVPHLAFERISISAKKSRTPRSLSSYRRVSKSSRFTATRDRRHRASNTSPYAPAPSLWEKGEGGGWLHTMGKEEGGGWFHTSGQT